MLNLKKWTLTALLLLIPGLSYGATRVAHSCDAASVQAAINDAAIGDTVKVQKGDCVWLTTVTIPAGMDLTLEGTGAKSTSIDATSTGRPLYVGVGNRRITGFTFICGYIEIDGEGWRIDHNTFTCDTFQNGVYVAGNRPQASPKGLVDHNTFINRRVIAYGYPGTTLGDLNHATQWFDPLALGTDRAVYVEDNSFTYTVFGNVMDCQHGGSYVFRHNTVTDSYAEAHSARVPSRACRKWEIYDNAFTATSSAPGFYWTMLLRGGTGVAYNNTFTGTFGSGTSLAIDNVRSYPVAPATTNECNGRSPWDGNADSTGWPCLDQIGRGSDSSIFNGTPPPYPVQNSEPAYFWNNTFGGVLGGVSVVNGAEIHIHANRDYFVNQGPKPGYRPYQYPHPLQRPSGQ